MDNLYEMMIINKPQLGDKEEKKLFTKVETLLGTKGKIIEKKDWGKKQLAYQIKKESEGKYWLLKLSFDPLAISPFLQKLKMEEDILRFMLIRQEEVKKTKSKNTKKKGKKVTPKKIK